MKRRDLIKHLEAHGCELLREGGNLGLRESGGPQDLDGTTAPRDQQWVGAEDLP